MDIYPDPTWRDFEAVEPGSIFFADLDGLTRCCLRTKIRAPDRDDAAIVLGPFAEGELGAAWLRWWPDGYPVLDFGPDWTAVLSSEMEHVRFGQPDDLSATGAIIRWREHRYIQAVMEGGAGIVFYNVATCATGRGGPTSNVAMITEWSIVLPRVSTAMARRLVYTVTAAEPKGIQKAAEPASSS